jgi:hypothetical protein
MKVVWRELYVELEGLDYDLSMEDSWSFVSFLAREVLRMFCLVCGCYLMLTLLGT